MSLKVFHISVIKKTPVVNFSLVSWVISPTQLTWASGESACNVKGLLIQLPTS